MSVANETLNRGAATSTRSPSHASYQRSVGILGGETAKQNLPSVRVARRNKTLRPCVKNHMQTLVHIADQRTLAEHGDVPVRRSVQDCATRENPHAVLRHGRLIH